MSEVKNFADMTSTMDQVIQLNREIQAIVYPKSLDKLIHRYSWGVVSLDYEQFHWSYGSEQESVLVTFRDLVFPNLTNYTIDRWPVFEIDNNSNRTDEEVLADLLLLLETLNQMLGNVDFTEEEYTGGDPAEESYLMFAIKIHKAVHKWLKDCNAAPVFWVRGTAYLDADKRTFKIERSLWERGVR